MLTKFALILALLTCYKSVKIKPLPFKNVKDCVVNGNSYFDSVTFSCKQCIDGTKPTSNGLDCECKPNHRFKDLYAKGLPVCEQCPPGQVISRDARKCLKCSASHSYQSKTQQCSPCKSNDVQVENITNSFVYCKSCGDLLMADKNEQRCVACPSSFFKDNKNKCFCPENKFAVINGNCVNKSLLLNENEYIYSITYEDTDVVSYYLKNNVRRIEYECRKNKLTLSCQALANICVLQVYREKGICSIVFNWKPNSGLPLTVYQRLKISDILTATSIDTHYMFPGSSRESRLNIYALKFSVNGTYLGITEVRGGLLQLCDFSFESLDKAYDFGTEYEHSCKLNAKKLWSDFKTEFFELYVKYDKSDPKLYPLPVRIKNLQLQGEYDNEGHKSNWFLVKRFTLVDNFGGIVDEGKPAKYVRYVSSFSLRISFQNAGEGKIEPPLVSLVYDVVSIEDHYKKDKEIEVSFSVSYFRSKWKHDENMRIAVGVLCGFGFLLSLIKTWGWLRRSGKDVIDFMTLIKLLTYTASVLSNILLCIYLALSSYFFLIFKRQDEAFLTLPTHQQEKTLRLVLYFIFILKILEIIDIVLTQITADIFLLDWEKPRQFNSSTTDPVTSESKSMAPVSIWRTYFIANEWNELQIIRRINPSIQLLTVIFFMKILGFEELTRIDPKSTFTETEWSKFVPYSQSARFSLTSILFISIALIQYIANKFIKERFIDDPLQQFVDLCYLSNISIFIFSNGRSGHYIHGRTGVGHADADMREMYEHLKREEDDLCSHRGLIPDTDDQVFEIVVPNNIRLQYNQLILPTQSRNFQANRMQQTGARSNKFINPEIDKFLNSYASMNRFLAGYIDHAIKDFDYQIREKGFLEKLLGIDRLEVTSNGFFYTDNNNSFNETLFYGCDWNLLIFELMIFNIVDLISHDLLICMIVTFIISQIIKWIRKVFGRRNVAHKTLIDQRFLI